MGFLTFDEWCNVNAKVPYEKWTMAQYANYVEGWKNSMPWSFKGMSERYYEWAQKNWQLVKDKELLIKYWRAALRDIAKCALEQRNELKGRNVESIADCYAFFFQGYPSRASGEIQ